MEYYSAIREDEYLLFTSMWTELEGIMLSAVSQSEKDSVLIHLGNIKNSEREYKGREKKCWEISGRMVNITVKVRGQ